MFINVGSKWEYAIEEASCRRFISLGHKYTESYLCANIPASPFLSISTDSRKAALSYYNVRVKVRAIRQGLQPRLASLVAHEFPSPQNVGVYCFISCSDHGEPFCKGATLLDDSIWGDHRGYIYANPVKDIISMDIPEPGFSHHHPWIMTNRIAEAPSPFYWIGHIISCIKQLRIGQDTHVREISIWQDYHLNIFTWNTFVPSSLDFGQSPRRICILAEPKSCPQMVYCPDINWPIERILDDLEQFNNTKDWSQFIA